MTAFKMANTTAHDRMSQSKERTSDGLMPFFQSPLKTGIAHLAMLNHHALKTSSKDTDAPLISVYALL